MLCCASIHDCLGSTSSSSWGISSIFGGGENRTTIKENSENKVFNEPTPIPIHGMEQSVSMIQLREVICLGLPIFLC